MGKQSQLLLQPTEVEFGLQVGVEFDNNFKNRSCHTNFSLGFSEIKGNQGIMGLWGMSHFTNIFFDPILKFNFLECLALIWFKHDLCKFSHL